jgi:hypothetical protein
VPHAARRVVSFDAYFNDANDLVSVLIWYRSRHWVRVLLDVSSRVELYGSEQERDNVAAYEYLTLRFVLLGPQDDDERWIRYAPRWCDTRGVFAHVNKSHPRIWPVAQLVDRLNPGKARASSG